MKKLFSLLAVSLLALGMGKIVQAQISVCPSSIVGYSDDQLQSLLAVCEAEIADRQGKLELTQKQATTIESIILQLRYKIEQSQLKIKSSKIKIAQLGEDIDVRSKNITVLNNRIERMHGSLTQLLRKSDIVSSASPVEALLSADGLSEFFVNVDNYDVLQGRLRTTLLDIKGLKSETETEKSKLETSRSKESELKYQQEQEKKRTENYRLEQEKVLKLTKSQADAYKKEIADKEKVKNAIRNRIFRTVGGQELRFEDALKLVQMYEGRVGVNAALTLAVLSQESSVDSLIGKNIGKCTYKQTAKNKAGTVMSPSQQPSFEAILAELGLNPDTTPVSCPIYSDGSYGGAMGPAQFMPSTWWNIGTGTGYKERVAKIIGNGTPSPFTSLDAFTGTALYLSDALERCRTAFSSTFELRACAAAKYYSGLGSCGSRLLGQMNPKSSYGYQLATRAAQFDKDIALLDQ